MAERTRRARYTAGRLADTGGADGGEVPDYAAEDGVDPARCTETFAEVVLELDSLAVGGDPLRAARGEGAAAAAGRESSCASVRCRTCPSARTAARPPRTSCGSAWTVPSAWHLHLTGSAPGPRAELVPLVLTGAAARHEAAAPTAACSWMS